MRFRCRPARAREARCNPLASQRFGTRLAAILDQLRQRHQRRQEHAADKLLANEFILGA
jgi:hypothetical protein